jgi:hypothetical protein
MKTAIQELFSKLETEHPNLFNTNTQEGRKFINDYYQFFELEKQQIIDAYADGIISVVTNEIINYDEYYNEKFKNNEK